MLRGFKQTAIQLNLVFHIGKMADFCQQIFLMSQKGCADQHEGNDRECVKQDIQFFLNKKFGMA